MSTLILKKYHCTMVITYANGEITAAMIGARYADIKPQGYKKKTESCRYRIDWHESHQEALNFVGAAKTA